MVKCLPELSIFTAFLKNKNIIFKIRRSKVTDYAALRISPQFLIMFFGGSLDQKNSKKAMKCKTK